VDLIVTPDEAIWCAKPHRPPGIRWEHLDPDKIAEVPALAALAARR
jgi:5-formyltetrahydrofolate cyclo-ligase